MKKYIIVTGGAGYIGSHVCKRLFQAGYIPVSIDNLSQGRRDAVQWGPIEICDIKDTVKLIRVFDKYNPVGVMHFAASAYVGESVFDPQKYYVNNVAGTLSVLEAMLTTDIKLFVFSSSCAIYGDRSEPINESCTKKPISPYGASKLFVERILNDYKIAYGIQFVGLRYFNAAGCDLDGDLGENHEPETHLIPLVIDGALGNIGCVKVYGTDYPTHDGTCVRDYIHVLDLADAHIAALVALEGGSESKFYNLSNGRGFSVLEIINAVEKVSGLKVPVMYCERRLGDPPSLVGDSSLITKELGWTPKYHNLDDIIKSAYIWKKSLKLDASQ